MKLAVMQPYIFPYIGYFQMIKAVDKFVFYDDVNFIKQGWINRNKILVSGQEFLFTVPLEGADSFRLISDTKIKERLYDNWKIKFRKTIDQSYKKAPFFAVVKELIDSIINKPPLSIGNLAIDSIVSVSKYLGIETEFVISSEAYQNQGLERQLRLVDICNLEKADHYINVLGGWELYSKKEFIKHGIHLNFIDILPIEYKQFKNEFVPWLSIIDVMMFNSTEEINQILDQYELV